MTDYMELTDAAKSKKEEHYVIIPQSSLMRLRIKVQGKTHHKHIFLPPQQKSPNEESSLHSGRHCDGSRESMDRNDKNFYFRADAKNQLFKAGQHQSSGEASDHSESFTSGSPSGTPRTGSFCSSQSSSPANLAQCTVQSKMELLSQEKLIKTQEEETNVDTGFTVLLSECWPLPLVRFSKELHDSVPNHGRAQNLSSGEVGSRNNRMSENPSHNSIDAINKYKSCGTGTLQFRSQPTSNKHGNRVEEEEEFFI
ncbi:protein FAM124B isoform X2 [Ambystoma mexicanum]|uniref:protein FAM124B isoform X2 n=1 Tax=Ambystoma mexicanum TaxID=8296 RepID=UPI0037E87D41